MSGNKENGCPMNGSGKKAGVTGGAGQSMIRECSISDLPILQKISRETFQSTFGDMNTQENMNAYLEEAFHPERLKRELENEGTSFYFIYENEELAGYLKLNESEAQTDVHDPASLELERIYVAGSFQGKGVGRRLMEKAVAEAARRKKTYLWLGVWEKNKKALAFYEKNGFYLMGTHAFVMGTEVQTDYLLRKDMNG